MLARYPTLTALRNAGRARIVKVIRARSPWLAVTAGGALPPRDEELARTGQWLGCVLETIAPAAAQRVARAYATWQVMRSYVRPSLRVPGNW